MGKKISKKEVDLIAAGKDLFRRFGFKRVSIEDLCKKAVVSKMTFYRLFSNKTDLAKRILDSILEDSICKFREVMDAPFTADERMRRIVALKMEGTREISREFIEDVYSDTGSELHRYMMQKTEEMSNTLVQMFAEAQNRGYFRSDFKPELLLALSRQMTALLEDKSVMALYDNPRDIIMELTTIIAFGIEPENREPGKTG